MMSLWAQEDYEGIDRDVRRATPGQIVFVLLVGGLLAANVSIAIGASWTFAGACNTAWGYWASRPTRPEPGVFRPLVRVTESAIASVVWTAAPAIFWFTGDDALRMVALALLATLMVVAQSFSFKSLSIAAAFALPPAVAFVLLPTVFGGFSGVRLVTVAICFLLALAYVLVDFRRNISNAFDLRVARDDLGAQTEAAVAANQAKSSFLAMMSHELRTPMNGVLGMAHALTLTRLTRLQTGYVEMLVRSGKDLMSILNDILDISKIESGKLELETTVFDLHDLGQRVHDLWAETARAKGVALVYDLADSTPRWVTGDPTRLRQIMTNLASNALKFTAEGEVRFTIAARGPGWCEIRVSDTGPGISTAQQGRLFQSFVQADVSTTRKFGGTGLGLAICRQLASLMGGDIQLFSQEGEGATFKVLVPLQEAAADEAAQADDATIEMNGLRILVADDNLVNQAVARAVLEAFGAAVCCANNGKEALERLSAESCDVVLMDVHMPVMGGIEALEEIRRGAAGPADRPVIALTADAMAGVCTNLLAVGFDDVAAKPINPAELGMIIAGVLSARKSRRAA